MRVAAPTVERVAQDPCLEHIHKLPGSEIEALIYCVLRDFARWSGGEILELDACVALIRNLCFVHSIPRFEAAGLIYAIRDSAREIERMERFRSGAEFEPDGHDEEGTRFFDLLVYELLKGY